MAELEKAVDCVPQEVQNNEDLTPDERLNALDELTERLQVRHCDVLGLILEPSSVILSDPKLTSAARDRRISFRRKPHSDFASGLGHQCSSCISKRM